MEKSSTILAKDDFIMTEDGRPQTIRYFTKESDLPLTLGLLVDTSLSQRRVLDQERSASHGFLDQMLRVDKDQAFIIHFDREVELLQDLTSSRDKLEVALEQLQTPQLSQTSGNDPSNSDPNSGRGSRRMGGRAGTLLYDAVYLASDELMKKQQGRKALVVLSDGVDHGSKETLESAIATAQRSDTVVYSILFKDDEREGGGGGFGGPHIGMGGRGMGGGMGRHGGGRGYPRAEERPDGKKVLERISKETGGRMFEVSKKDPIDQIYDQIAEELRSQYSLGYTPDRAADAGPLYRKIQLTTKQNGLVVQTGTAITPTTSVPADRLQADRRRCGCRFPAAGFETARRRPVPASSKNRFLTCSILLRQGLARRLASEVDFFTLRRTTPNERPDTDT